MRTFSAMALLASILSGGCAGHAVAPKITTAQSIRDAVSIGLTPPVMDDTLKAVVTPPDNWKADPIKVSDKHRHRVWISPTGATAYGVIYFDLPLPVGTDLALWGFMRQMRQSEGEGNLLSKVDDNKLPGVRFVAEGGLYKVRSNMTVDGLHGWVVYAGTIRARPINTAELKLAEAAREQTKVNR